MAHPGFDAPAPRMANNTRSRKQNTENATLFSAATNLRRHLLGCNMCKGAIRALAENAMCNEGLRLACEVAKSWSFMLEMRKSADPENAGLIYACPDPAEHGEAYALTAERYKAVAIQNQLF